MPEKAIGKYRWTIVTLLFFATTINYLDRQVMGLVKTDLAKQFNWTEVDYSHIVMAFTAAYAVGLLLFGKYIDIIGTKKGYVLSIIVWSLSAMSTALVGGTFSFASARAALGLGESGNFPAAIKAVAEWFPKKERALATGIFNSGSNVAAMIGPPVVTFLWLTFSWRAAFIWTGAVGFIWLIFWSRFYNSPDNALAKKELSPEEFAYIHHEEGEEATAEKKAPVSWGKILGVRQSWAFIVGKFLTDPVWWFYLFWIPSYFITTFGIDPSKSWVCVSVLYTVASFGSIFGGYLSGWLMKRGIPAHKARKTAMFIFALCVVPVMFIRFTHNPWVAVAFLSVAAAAHQAWSANIFTTASDMFPKYSVSSVVGIGGMAGSIGGVLFPLVVGLILDHFKVLGHLSVGYNLIFLMCGLAYLLAWIIMHFLCPRMVRVQFKD
jgi:ACS family hexuronate transporter-like MFS transporter